MRLEKEAQEKEMNEKMMLLEEQRKKQEEELEAKKKELMNASGQNAAARKAMEDQLKREKEMFELELQEQRDEMRRQKEKFEEEQRLKNQRNEDE